MKKFKKLIPALCMLLISAVLMGTSTYAWFSMNESVKAEGMQVTAKSNSTYLLITNTKDATGANPGTSTLGVEQKFTDTTKEVYPTAYTTTEIKKEETTLINANSWYTCNNTVSSAATGNEVNYKSVTLGDTSYFAKYTVYLTLSKDSEDWEGTLKVKMARLTSADQAVSAVVVIGSENFNFTGATPSDQTTTSNVKLTNATQVEVTIYVYLNGTSTNVNSDFVNNDSNSLSGAISVTVELGTKKAA